MNKSEATEKGKIMLRKMRGKGWKLHVFENIGWHCYLTNKLCGLNVHPTNSAIGGTQYWAMMDSNIRPMSRHHTAMRNQAAWQLK